MYHPKSKIRWKFTFYWVLQSGEEYLLLLLYLSTHGIVRRKNCCKRKHCISFCTSLFALHYMHHTVHTHTSSSGSYIESNDVKYFYVIFFCMVPSGQAYWPVIWEINTITARNSVAVYSSNPISIQLQPSDLRSLNAECNFGRMFLSNWFTTNKDIVENARDPRPKRTSWLLFNQPVNCNYAI